MRSIAALLALACALLFTACGNEDPPTSSPSSSGGSGSSPPPAPSDNPKGLDASKDLSTDLKTLCENMLAWSKSDPSRFNAVSRSLLLSDPGPWLKASFGDELGGRWAERNAKFSGSFENEMAKLFEKIRNANQTNLTVYRLTSPEDPHATGSQKDALKAMKTPFAIYTVKFIAPGEDAGMSVWSWAYVEDGFKLLGKP
jgi:hypothetical protein